MQALLPIIVGLVAGLLLAVFRRVGETSSDRRDHIERDIELRKKLSLSPEDSGARTALTHSIRLGAESLTQDRPSWLVRFLQEWGGSLGVLMICVGLSLPFILAGKGIEPEWKAIGSLLGIILGGLGGTGIGVFKANQPQKPMSKRKRKRLEKKAEKSST